MNWDYWNSRYKQQQGKADWRSAYEHRQTPLEKSGLKIIDWGTSGIYVNKTDFAYNIHIKTNGETCRTKYMKFLTKANLIEDVDFQMVN